jgi:uncharacterized protein
MSDSVGAREGAVDRMMSRKGGQRLPMIVVFGMLIASSAMMAMAWLGHLRFQEEWSFWTALTVSWLIVLPEYALNTAATRAGYGSLSGAQMASVHLSGGVVFVALVSLVVLDEPLTPRTLLGFGTMFLAIILIMGGRSDATEPEDGNA